MALSPNYQWAEPDNSSLVKNGAQDIRALGDAIDTSVWNVGYGQAGKNKIINGDFTINQRSFTSNTSSGDFNFDRFFQTNSGGTFTVTPQTFTLGAAPVAGYEGKTFLQGITTGQSGASDLAWFCQKIESVRTYAGQTVTVSFYAKAATGTPKIAVELAQNFGTGGSPSSAVNTYAGQVTLSTSFARYSLTIAVPSISGKTLGTSGDHLRLNLMTSAGSDFNARSGSLGVQNNTFQFWGVQVEYGSKATPFQTASGGSIQGELAMCQRYYFRQNPTGSINVRGQGIGVGASSARIACILPVTMRILPSAVDFSTLGINDTSTTQAVTAISIAGSSSPNIVVLDCTVASGLTQFRPYFLTDNSSFSAFLGFTAEL